MFVEALEDGKAEIEHLKCLERTGLEFLTFFQVAQFGFRIHFQ